MKYLIIFICNTISLFCVSAQIDTYGIYIVRDSLRHIHRVAEVNDDRIITFNNGFLAGETLCNKMIAYDWQGQLLWYNKTCEIDSNRISSAFLQKNLLNGNQLLFVGNGGGSIGAITLLELEYNGQFDKVLVHDFNENDYLSVQSTLENSQNIFVVGNKALNNSLWNSKAFLLATNKELEFDQYFEVNTLPRPALFNDIIIDYDGKLLISGTEERIHPQLEEESNFAFWHKLYKYCPIENDTIWSIQNPFANDSLTISPESNAFAPEATFYMETGNYFSKFKEGYLFFTRVITNNVFVAFNNKLNHSAWQITHVNQDFEHQWAIHIEDTMQYAFERPLILHNNDIILAGIGYTNHYKETPLGAGIPYSLYFKKISSSGEILWTRSYSFLPDSGINERDVFSIQSANFFQHPQGGYLLFGSIRTENNEGETGQDVLWAWIDEEGCIQNDICAEPFQWLYTPEPNDPGMQAYYTSNVIPLQPYYDFKLFPNPAKDQLNIQLEQVRNIQAINIYNSSGTLVFSKKQLLNENIIDIQQWESGIYLVNVLQNGRSFTKKFVKE